MKPEDKRQIRIWVKATARGYGDEFLHKALDLLSRSPFYEDRLLARIMSQELEEEEDPTPEQVAKKVLNRMKYREEG